MSTLELKEQRKTAINESRTLLEQHADGSPMNPADAKRYDELNADIERLGREIEAAEQDEQGDAQFRAKVGGAGETAFDRRLWVQDTSRKLQSAYREQRAVNSGSIDVTAPVGRIVEIARPGVRVKNLLSAPSAPAGANGTSYLRQTVRTNNAEFVADSGQKPVSVYTIVEVSDRLRTLAHLSESIPARYLEDSAQLQRFIESEMPAGLDARLDDAILNGDDDSGTTDEFDGLMKLSGAEVAFDTSIVETAANVLTAQLDAGEEPNAFIMNSADWQGLSLTREETSGQYLFGQPADGAGRRLYGIPVVLSPSMASGSAMLGDFRQADLLHKDTSILWNGADMALFQYNLVVVRVETRVVLRVYRPASFKNFATSAT